VDACLFKIFSRQFRPFVRPRETAEILHPSVP
jgi:hypothetical protein